MAPGREDVAVKVIRQPATQRLTSNHTPAVAEGTVTILHEGGRFLQQGRDILHLRLGGETVRHVAAVLGLASLFGCGLVPSPPASGRLHLVEKGRFEALYGGDGHLLRVVSDRNGDGQAEMVTIFSPGGSAIRAQIDTDGDGVVDRWEYYGPDGRVAKVGSSRRSPGKPDTWSYPDGFGGVGRREYDDDGDGIAERAEDLLDGVVVAEELDTDGDGRRDRRLVRGPSGAIERIETDPDGEGHWQRSVPVTR
jgi:hypothetical protein